MIDNKKNKGFTLIETLVAVMILATSIAGPLSIAAKSLNVSITAKNQISAFFLAQDAVEYVRYARDTNTLSGTDWIAGLGAGTPTSLTACQSANGCYLDSTVNNPGSPTACTSAGCVADGTTPSLSYDSTTLRFTYATGSGISKSIFTRSILLSAVAGNPNEQKLTVTISWLDNANATVPRSITVNEFIYAWQ